MTTQLTPSVIADAMKGHFFLDAEKAAIVNRAVTAGYLLKISFTQVQWTDEGLAQCRADERRDLDIERIAAKLFNDGLDAATYDRTLATEILNRTVAPNYCLRVLDTYEEQIVAIMGTFVRTY